jgi:hypothetical protein
MKSNTNFNIFFAYTLPLLFFVNINNVLSQENAKAIGDSLFRPIQVSFIPYLSTNGYLSDKVSNNISLNILGGYVKEVREAEFGGLFNMVRKDAGKCQVACFGNLVGGTSSGFQGAGTFNITRKQKGIQTAGIVNITGEAAGIQVAGVVNQAAKGNCTQLAGLVNNSGDSAVFQVSGLVNNSSKVSQFQIAGLVNNTMDVSGFQVAGLLNNAAKVDKFQIAGLVNNTKGETGFQIAGLVNQASKINSIQIAGLVNSSKEVQGVQISGLVNHASFFKGVQIGVINIADSCQGVSIGLVNWVRNGYHRLEISADELFYANLAFRSGVRKLHSIITTGIAPDKLGSPLWTYGTGMGTSFLVGNKTLFDIDGLIQTVIKDDYIDNNYLGKIYIGIDRKLAGTVSVSFGVTYNFLVTDTRQHAYTEKYADIAPYHFTDHTYHNHFNMKTWAGAKLGLRFF